MGSFSPINLDKEERRKLTKLNLQRKNKYKLKNNFVDKLYPNTVELSSIDGESITEWADIELQSHGQYSKKFLQDYYGDLTKNSIYKNKIYEKKVIWKGHIKDLEYMKHENYLGWILSFDDKYEVSNHLPISHWGLRHGTT